MNIKLSISLFQLEEKIVNSQLPQGWGVYLVKEVWVQGKPKNIRPN